MKLANKLIYLSLCLATILLLQTLESTDQNLNLLAQKTEVCVDFYSDGSGSLVTQDERDKADSILNSLYDSNVWDDILNLINTKQFDAAIINHLLRYIVPWAIFLIISLFGWIFYCCYCVCDKKCPPSKCCKRDYSEKKLEKKEFYIPIAFAVVLNLLLGGAAIAGLVNAGDVERGLKAARCSLVSLFSDINNSQGLVDSDFPGLIALAKSVQDISDQLTQFQSNLTSTFSDGTSSKIKTKKDNVITQNNNMKRGGSNAAVPVSDSGTETYLSSMNFVDYMLMSSTDSDKDSIIQNYGTLSSNSAYSSYLKCTPQPEALSAYYDALIEVAAQLESTSSSITSSGFDSASINSGSDTINSFVDQIESSGNQLYDNTAGLSDYGGYVSLALNVLFGVSLGLSVVSLATIVLMLLMKMYQLRGLLHFAWCIYVILMILCFLLALLLHPASVVFAELCQYLEKFLSDSSFYNSAKFIDSADTKDIISTCFFPTTSNTLYDVMGLDAAMKPLNSFTAYLTAFQAGFSNMTSSKSDFQAKLDANLASVLAAKEGTVFDVPSASLSTYQAAFTAFNNLKSNSGCVELAVATCSDGKKPMKSSSNTGSDYNTNCWHPVYLASSTPACSQQSGSADTTTLKTQYQKQASLWATAYSSEQNILTLNAAVSTDFDTYMAKINNFITGAQNLVNSLDSLLKGINCTFLQLSFQNVIDGLCVIFIPGISRTTILIIIIAVSMFFGSLSNCCIGLRAYRIKEYGLKGEGSSKIQPQNNDQEMVAITKGQS